MASRVLLVSLLLLAIVATSVGDRGRDVRRRRPNTTSTTTTPAPSVESSAEATDESGAEAASGASEEKQSCEGEPGCEWRCGEPVGVNSAPLCTCHCAAPQVTRDVDNPLDSSYFQKK